jgi:hypothetical protein
MRKLCAVRYSTRRAWSDRIRAIVPSIDDQASADLVLRAYKLGFSDGTEASARLIEHIVEIPISRSHIFGCRS